MSSPPPTPESERAARLGPLVGVLGAGQLGRMLALAGYPLGVRCLFVDPNAPSPAGEVAEQFVEDYTSQVALDRLATCDVVTYEFESVPVDAALALAARTRVLPPPDALRIAQDRLSEKQCFRELGIPTAPFEAVSSLEELELAARRIGLPAVLKTRRFGYDGKGQWVLKRREDLAQAWEALGSAPLLLEGFVPFERELSLLGVRARDGTSVFYPLVENHHREGILRLTWAPAPRLDAPLTARAESYLGQLLDRLDYVGVLALELFEIQGELYANEMAPRVHNSGHFSIEGAETSQFENHLRAVLGLPLGPTYVRAPTAMLNIVGELPDPEHVLRVPGAHLHLYGKAPRPRRKLGHITTLAPSLEELRARVDALLELPGVG